MGLGNYDGSLKFDTKLDTSGFQGALGKLGGIAVKSVGAVTGALAAMGVAATKIGMDFEAQMSKVGAISQASAEDMGLLTEKAKQMGIDTKFSATEAGQALEYMAMAGWKTEDMLGGIDGVMNLAAASGEDLGMVSDIVTDALTAFGLQAKDSAHFADVLAAASSNANTDVSKMGGTFQYVAPVAGAMKFSIEDTAVAIGLMANAGIKAEKAGTALRSIFTRLAKPPKEAANAIKALGLQTQNADGSFKSLSAIMTDMRGKFATLTDAEKTQYAAMLGGQEAMSGLLSIVNASEEDFQKLTKAIEESDGSAKRMADTMNDNLKGQLTLLKSSLEGLGLAIYEKIDEPMKEMVKTSIESVNGITDSFKNGNLEDALIGVGNLFGEMAADLSVKIANAAPAMVDSAISLIQSFVAGIQLKLPEITQSAFRITESFVKGITSLLPQILQAGIDIIVNLGQGMAQSIPQLLTDAVDVILKLCDQLLDNMDSLVDTGITLTLALADGIVEAVPKILDKAPEIIEKVILAFANNSPKMMEAGLQLILKLGVGLIKSIPSLLMCIPQLIVALVKGFMAYNNKVSEIGNNIVKGIWEGISNFGNWLYGKIKDFCGNVVDKVKGFFGIHSPSKVFEKQVGEMLPLGEAKGIENKASEVYKALEIMNDGMLEIENKYLSEKARIDAERAKQEEAKQEKEYQKRLKNAKTAAEQEEIKQEEILRKQKLADDKYLEELKAKSEEEQKILEEQKKAIVSAYTEIAKSAKEKLSEIEQAQTKLADKLKAYGSLYTEWTTTIKGGGENGQDLVFKEYRLNDLSKDIETLEAYKNALLAVKERGAPEGFFEVLQDLGIDEGTQFANTLLGLSDEEFKKYLDDWNRKNEVADSISKEFYKDKTDEALQQIDDELREWYGTIPKGFLTEGKLSAEKFGEGFLEQLQKVFKEVKEAVSLNVSRISPMLAFAGGGAGGGTTTYTTTNQTFTIGTSKNTTSEQIAQWQNAAEVARLRGQN